MSATHSLHACLETMCWIVAFLDVALTFQGNGTLCTSPPTNAPPSLMLRATPDCPHSLNMPCKTPQFNTILNWDGARFGSTCLQNGSACGSSVPLNPPIPRGPHFAAPDRSSHPAPRQHVVLTFKWDTNMAELQWTSNATPDDWRPRPAACAPSEPLFSRTPREPPPPRPPDASTRTPRALLPTPILTVNWDNITTSVQSAVTASPCTVAPPAPACAPPVASMSHMPYSRP